MSTTVSYKGQTLATVSNQTKTLLTEGKYLEDDLTLVDVSGGGSTLITKNISANGTYNASSDSADGYSQVTVAVPNTYTNADEGKVVSEGALVAQTSKNINSNGTHSTVTNNQVVVAVPNSYSAGDEGKVVSNGALVAQTSDTVTENDTYDTTLINSLTVNVSGGSNDVKSLIENTVLSLTTDATTVRNSMFRTAAIKAIELTACTRIYSNAFESSNVESVIMPNCTRVDDSVFVNCTKLKSLNAPKLREVYNGGFKNTRIPIVVLPALTTLDRSAFDSCSQTTAIDVGSPTNTTQNYTFNNCSLLGILIIRGTNGVFPIGNINVFNGSPFASNGTGGTLYVPSSLVSSYQSATNWSTILGYANNQIKSIESTHTDPTAPIDLTLYYADGTPIS